MADFNKHIDNTLKWEGGYSNNTNDTGGETYRGISRIHNPTWQGWKVVDAAQPKYNEIIPSLEPIVKQWYKQHYWNRIRLDEVCNERVAGFIFDWYVNSGNLAIKKLQGIVGAAVDGIIGNETIYKTNNYDSGLFEKLKIARISFVKAIVRNNPSQKVFLNGWLNRINSFK